MKKRPKIKIILSNTDWIMELVGAVFLILMIVFPAFYYDQLPETIPTHFDFYGVPDGYGSKSIMWTLVIIGVVLYVGLTILNLFPSKFNYITELDSTNAAKQYRLSTTLMRRIKLLIAICFFELEYCTIQVALNSIDGLNTYVMLTLLIAITGVIVDYFYQTYKA